MQRNVPTKPALGFVSSPAPTEHKRRQVHVGSADPCGIPGALPAPTIQMAASLRNTLTIWISLLSCSNFNFQRFCPGPFAALYCFTWSELFSFRGNSLSLPKLLFPGRCSPHISQNKHSIPRLARKHKFQGQYPKASSAGPKSQTNSLSPLQFTVSNCFGRCITK